MTAPQREARRTAPDLAAIAAWNERQRRLIEHNRRRPEREQEQERRWALRDRRSS